MADGWLEDGAPGYLPGVQEIRAALRVARLVGEHETLQPLRSSYTRVPTGGLLSSEDFRRGEALLHRLGLLRFDGNRVLGDERLSLVAAMPSEEAQALLMSVILDREPPPWLGAATAEGELRPELVSDRDRHVLEQVVVDPDERERILLNEARRVDPGAMKALGDLGEEFVYRAYRERMKAAGRDPDTVIWVAKVSDRLGYDVSSPREGDGKHRCEVKTTRSLGSSMTVQLSRHEAETGQVYPEQWALVICRADDQGRVEVLGWTRIDQLIPLLPEDRGPTARWSAVELRISRQDLRDGLPE